MVEHVRHGQRIVGCLDKALHKRLSGDALDIDQHFVDVLNCGAGSFRIPDLVLAEFLALTAAFAKFIPVLFESAHSSGDFIKMINNGQT